MEVKFLKTTNSNFTELEGVLGDLSYGLTLHFDFNNDLNPEYTPSFDLRHGTMHSSVIENINIYEKNRAYYIIHIKTRNSDYFFGNGKENDLKPFSDREILDLQIASGMHLF